MFIFHICTPRLFPSANPLPAVVPIRCFLYSPPIRAASLSSLPADRNIRRHGFLISLIPPRTLGIRWRREWWGRKREAAFSVARHYFSWVPKLSGALYADLRAIKLAHGKIQLPMTYLWQHMQLVEIPRELICRPKSIWDRSLSFEIGYRPPATDRSGPKMMTVYFWRRFAGAS